MATKTLPKTVTDYRHAFTTGAACADCDGDMHIPGAAFYVSVVRDWRGKPDYRLLAGPFTSHIAALRLVSAARLWAEENDPRAIWYSYGTLSIVDGDGRPGLANDALGVEAVS